MMKNNRWDDTRQCSTARDVQSYLASVENDTSFHRKYRMIGVPETTVISGNGIVEGTWLGELNAEQSEQIAQEVQGE